MEDISQELPPGTRLGNYLIERTLGQGGFGITYLATNTALDVQVVVKENLPFGHAYRDTATLDVYSQRKDAEEGSFEWSVQNFRNEARTLAKLDHPHIVRVTDSFRALGTAYYVMPYIKGVSLDKYHASYGDVTEEWLRNLLTDILGALTYLHGENILHRDIKPANILLTVKGHPHLIDFGSARQMLSERTQTALESIGYTPFEQTESHGNVGPWSDLYALGGTLYYLITHEKPPKSSDRIRRDPYRPLAARAELQGTFSLPFLQSIDKALAVWPEDRWQSAEEWLRELPAAPIAAPTSALPKNADGEKEGILPIPAPKKKKDTDSIAGRLTIIGTITGTITGSVTGYIIGDCGSTFDCETGIIIGAITGVIIGTIIGGLMPASKKNKDVYGCLIVIACITGFVTGYTIGSSIIGFSEGFLVGVLGLIFGMLIGIITGGIIIFIKDLFR